MSSYTTSPSMRQMIEGFEGLRLDAYQDSVGVWTIGYGHTPATPGQAITQEQADSLMASDLARFERSVNGFCANSATTQGQFDAMVSFAYNLGAGALGGSTLLRLHRAGDYDGAAQEFLKWDHAGGQVLAGLTRRREAEAQVYADASPA
jgi:lysozyme